MATHWSPANADVPASGVTPGTYGDATHVGQVTVDAAGRITAAADVGISGGGGGGGGTLDLVTRNTPLTVTATSAATAETFIDGSAVTYDGSTLVKVEFFTPYGAASQFLAVSLWDGATDLGVIAQTNLVEGCMMYGATPLTPSAGSHTFHIKAWRGTGSANLNPDVGGPGLRVSAFYQVTAL